MNLIEKYRDGKKAQTVIEELDLKGKRVWKAVIFAFLITFMIAIPFILIILACYFIYSPVLPFYWVLTALASILIVIANGLSAAIYLKLLKNYYPEHDELKETNPSSFFIKEVLHPFSIIIIAIYFSFIIFVL